MDLKYTIDRRRKELRQFLCLAAVRNFFIHRHTWFFHWFFFTDFLCKIWHTKENISLKKFQFSSSFLKFYLLSFFFEDINILFGDKIHFYEEIKSMRNNLKLIWKKKSKESWTNFKRWLKCELDRDAEMDVMTTNNDFYLDWYQLKRVDFWSVLSSTIYYQWRNEAEWQETFEILE